MNMMLHAAAAMKCWHHRIFISTMDTDVVLLMRYLGSPGTSLGSG